MTITGRLHIAFELGEMGWKLSLSDAVHGPSRYTVAAGDKDYRGSLKYQYVTGRFDITAVSFSRCLPFQS